MSACLVDSSAFLSLEDRNEERHEIAMATFRELNVSRTELLTTNFVFDETYTLLLAKLGRVRAFAWGERFLQGGAIGLLRIEEPHESRAWEILRVFEDKDFSYTDATSFAVAEDLGIDSAFAFDQHFVQYGGLRVLP